MVMMRCVSFDFFTGTGCPKANQKTGSVSASCTRLSMVRESSTATWRSTTSGTAGMAAQTSASSTLIVAASATLYASAV